jgi:hypothetical protein
MRELYACFLVVFFIMYNITVGYAQCSSVPLAPHSSCSVGTPITSNNSGGPNAGVRYADGTLAGLSGGTAGFQRYNYAMSAGDTLRICGNAKIELTNNVLKVIVVEAGSTLLLTNTSYSGAIISNYGTIILSNNFNLNSPSVLINATLNSLIDAQGNDINNSALIVNNGFFENVGTFKSNNSSANFCMGDQSVLQAANINNVSPSSGGFTSSGTGVGCVSYSTNLQGKCLTEDGTPLSDSHISFCGASGSTIGTVTNCGATSGSVFGTAQHSSSCSACTSPLPVSLLYFTATKGKEGVVLDWKTTTEWNSDHFVVERSSDGIHWTLIATIPSVGDSKIETTYSTNDPEPNIGLNYYKLIEVDKQGNKKEYSVTLIEVQPISDFWVFPNPNNGNVNVNIFGNSEMYEFEIFDLTGKSLLHAKLGRGVTPLGHVPYAAGLYVARLKVGHVSVTQKFVIQQKILE